MIEKRKNESKTVSLIKKEKNFIYVAFTIITMHVLFYLFGVPKLKEYSAINFTFYYQVYCITAHQIACFFAGNIIAHFLPIKSQYSEKLPSSLFALLGIILFIPSFLSILVGFIEIPNINSSQIRNPQIIPCKM